MEVLRTEVESDENEEERVEWGTRKYGVRMSHPGYVGRGDDTCGGEVVYTIQDRRSGHFSALNPKMHRGG